MLYPESIITASVKDVEQKEIQWRNFDEFKRYADSNVKDWSFVFCHSGPNFFKRKKAEAIAKYLRADRINNNSDEKTYRFWNESGDMITNLYVAGVKFVFTRKSLDDALGLKWGEEEYGQKRDKKKCGQRALF
jgi:hypothetical protein